MANNNEIIKGSYIWVELGDKFDQKDNSCFYNMVYFPVRKEIRKQIKHFRKNRKENSIIYAPINSVGDEQIQVGILPHFFARVSKSHLCGDVSSFKTGAIKKFKILRIETKKTKMKTKTKTVIATMTMACHHHHLLLHQIYHHHHLHLP